MTDEIKRVRISTIKIGKQFREDMGDLDELAASIEECLVASGMPQPVNQLVYNSGTNMGN